MGGLAHSTQPWDLLVSDASISGIGSPSLSMTHQHENSSYPPIVGEVSLLFTWMYGSSLNVLIDHHTDGQDCGDG
jgi:hypothetical protein